jgi:diaminohydroxyphosphoribosylaminopyrimidine deaminase/5-amino-6-(5-phosphoribosylamino)uracil reductase
MAAPTSTPPPSPQRALPTGRERPFVRLKIAASLDGITALPNGQSQWITSAEARLDGHRWRARADCILTGIGTVLADDPRMDVRLSEAADPSSVLVQPALVILDSSLRTPAHAALFEAARPVHIFSTTFASSEAEAALQDCGAQVHRLPASSSDPDRLDLSAVLATLARRGIAKDVHVEAGACLSGALLRAGLVDEVVLYLAPTLLGAGRPLAELGQLAALESGIALDWESIDRVGADLRIVARVVRRTAT